MGERLIFHIDVNSAFLSWTAAYRVRVLGEASDLRDVPSAVGGDRSERKGIVLAKSTPAKEFGVKTGEPIGVALEKCPALVVVPADYKLYVDASRKFVSLLREISPAVEQYSIDEAWADMTGTEQLYGSAMAAAELIRRRVKEELGFTVNIGISSNKLLAKMAGDFEKPDKIHTLFSEEIPVKLWPLPVRDLFLVGRATEKKLHAMGIYTIGELASADVQMLRRRLYKPGETLWHFANGRCTDRIFSTPQGNKGYGNSVTMPEDVLDRDTACQVLLSLCETVGMRMRRDGKKGRCVTVQIRTSDFQDSSHQRKLESATDVTEELYREACRLFDEHWDGETPLRQLGVQVSQMAEESGRQFSFFEQGYGARYERLSRVDSVVDELREKYGERVLFRARFTGSAEQQMAGGLAKERRTGVTKPV
ncbi:MAG: DNA polymerase IV [Oscillospiraceae bacterium]|nr:DNA polymerase IV [Oscillospiraceae bacterium]